MGSSAFNDVEMVSSTLGYRLTTIGGLSIVNHPRMGTSIYLGNALTSASPDEIRAALGKLS